MEINRVELNVKVLEYYIEPLEKSWALNKDYTVIRLQSNFSSF